MNAVWKRDGKFYLGTEDWRGYDEQEVSEDFYLAWVKEFGNEDKPDDK
jgi:hypothetical protein